MLTQNECDLTKGVVLFNVSWCSQNERWNFELCIIHLLILYVSQDEIKATEAHRLESHVQIMTLFNYNISVYTF